MGADFDFEHYTIASAALKYRPSILDGVSHAPTPQRTHWRQRAGVLVHSEPIVNTATVLFTPCLARHPGVGRPYRSKRRMSAPFLFDSPLFCCQDHSYKIRSSTAGECASLSCQKSYWVPRPEYTTFSPNCLSPTIDLQQAPAVSSLSPASSFRSCFIFSYCGVYLPVRLCSG